MKLFRDKRNVVPLASALVGFAMLVHGMGDGQQAINGAEAQQIFGGSPSPTCNAGAALSGNTDCLGMCANNATYTNVGANGTATSSLSCGTCGGYYTGSVTCPML